MRIPLRPGLIVHDRRRPAATGAAIVVGPGRGKGQLRICRWRGGRQHWRMPITIATKQLELIVDWTLLPLTAAKRLAATAFERNYLVAALASTQGSTLEAALLAGVDRSNFRRLLQRHGLVKLVPRAKRPRRWGRRPS